MNKKIEKLYITETEAAERYGYSRQWFQRARWKKEGPPYKKHGNGKILYNLKEIDAYFEMPPEGAIKRQKVYVITFNNTVEGVYLTRFKAQKVIKKGNKNCKYEITMCEVID